MMAIVDIDPTGPLLTSREDLGKQVRRVWLDWAWAQPNPKASWLLEWEQLGEPDREVDRMIGEELYRRAICDLAASAE